MMNILIKKPLLIILLFLLLLAPTAEGRDFRWEKKISDGIDYIYLKKLADHGWVHAHILKVDILRGDIDIRPALARNMIGHLDPVPSIAKNNNAIAAVNGSFFDARKKPHLPVGIISIDGKMLNKSILPRCAFGITAGQDIIIGMPSIKSRLVLVEKGKSFPVWGINRPRKNDEVILYTSEWGKSTRTNQFGIEVAIKRGKVDSIRKAAGNSHIPEDGYVVSLHGASRAYADWFSPGEDVFVDFNLGSSWQMVNHVVSGGPLLIQNGSVVVKKTVMEEVFQGKLLKRSARTAIGETKDKKLLLVVVDKRRGISEGLFYSELAEIMLKEGAWNAMGLDGGSSSSMYLDGKIVSYPSSGYSIPVSNAIIVKKDGYVYSAKKPAVLAKVPVKPAKKEFVPEAITTKEVIATKEAEAAVYPDGLTDIYNKLIKPMFADREAEERSAPVKWEWDIVPKKYLED